MRKYVSRRLVALNEGEIAVLMTAMRPVGEDSQGGGEALVILDEWMGRVFGNTQSTNQHQRNELFRNGRVENAMRNSASCSPNTQQQQGGIIALSLICGRKRCRTNAKRSRSRTRRC